MAACLDLVGGKWRGSILFLLLQGATRFNAMRRLLGDPPARSLSDQLKALESHGLITRNVGSGNPPEVSYDLTARGETLRPVLTALADWGLGRMLEEGAALPHDRLTRQRAAELAGPREPGS
ncbi:MAG: helix-turn-helix domain-containing protein [Pseudomonadota bacterium]